MRYIHDDTNDTHITQIDEDKGVEFPIQVPMSLLPHCDATKVPLQGLWTCCEVLALLSQESSPVVFCKLHSRQLQFLPPESHVMDHEDISEAMTHGKHCAHAPLMEAMQDDMKHYRSAR